jgi:hypothetical protein
MNSTYVFPDHYIAIVQFIYRGGQPEDKNQHKHHTSSKNRPYRLFIRPR